MKFGVRVDMCKYSMVPCKSLSARRRPRGSDFCFLDPPPLYIFQTHWARVLLFGVLEDMDKYLLPAKFAGGGRLEVASDAVLNFWTPPHFWMNWGMLLKSGVTMMWLVLASPVNVSARTGAVTRKNGAKSGYFWPMTIGQNFDDPEWPWTIATHYLTL